MIFPKLTRSLIANAKGKELEIVWPDGGPEPKQGNVYTVQSSHKKAGGRSIEVKRAIEQPDGRYRVVVKEFDEPRLLRMSTKVDPDPADALQFRPEYEPEQVDQRYQRIFDDEGELKTIKCGRRHRDARSQQRDDSRSERSNIRLERLIAEAPK